MRIIGGALKGTKFTPPSNLPVRPTTDLAKEALFNILQNKLDWTEIVALDLFSGTGNITLELASRQVKKITAVDSYGKCCAYIDSQKKKFHFEQVDIVKYDALKYISNCKKKFDFIFADPPYDLPQLPQIPKLIFQYELLNEGGLLVLEHPSTKKLDESTFHVEQRKYGYSSFSIFKMS